MHIGALQASSNFILSIFASHARVVTTVLEMIKSGRVPRARTVRLVRLRQQLVLQARTAHAAHLNRQFAVTEAVRTARVDPHRR